MTYDLYNEIKACIQKTQAADNMCIFYGQQIESIEFAKVLAIIFAKRSDSLFLTTLRQAVSDVEKETHVDHSAVNDTEEGVLTTNQKIAIYSKAFDKLMECMDGRDEADEIVLKTILAQSLSSTTLEKSRVFSSQNDKDNCFFENGARITSIIELLEVLNSETTEKTPVFINLLKHGMTSYVYKYFKEAATDDHYNIEIDDRNCTDTSSTMKTCMNSTVGDYAWCHEQLQQACDFD